jgi:hypothetical protein
VQVGFEVAHPAFEALIGLDAVFRLFPLLQDALRFFGFVPETWFGEFFFEGSQAFAIFGDVKDSSAPTSRAREAGRSGAANLRASSSFCMSHPGGPGAPFG